MGSACASQMHDTIFHIRPLKVLQRQCHWNRIAGCQQLWKTCCKGGGEEEAHILGRCVQRAAGRDGHLRSSRAQCITDQCITWSFISCSAQPRWLVSNTVALNGLMHGSMTTSDMQVSRDKDAPERYQHGLDSISLHEPAGHLNQQAQCIVGRLTW